MRALRNQLGAVPALPGQVSDDQGVPHMTSVGQPMCVRLVAVIQVAVEATDLVHQTLNFALKGIYAVMLCTCAAISKITGLRI